VVLATSGCARENVSGRARENVSGPLFSARPDRLAITGPRRCANDDTADRPSRCPVIFYGRPTCSA
jgi:hypothetical protein